MGESRFRPSGKQLRTSGRATNTTPTSAGRISAVETGRGDSKSLANASRGNMPANVSSGRIGNAADMATVGGIIVQGAEGVVKLADWFHDFKMKPFQEKAANSLNAVIEKEKAIKDMEERNKAIHEIFNELSNLSKAGELSGSQKEQASELIANLKRSYDSKDISVALNEENGQITGLDKTIADRLKVEQERRVKSMKSLIDMIRQASQQFSDVAVNSGADLGVVHVGGSQTANRANQTKGEIDKILDAKMKEFNILRKQDPSASFLQRRRSENEVAGKALAKRSNEQKRINAEKEFNLETDPEKRIANRRLLIEDEKVKQSELQKSINAAQTAVKERADAKDEPGRLEAERHLLRLQERMAGSRETVSGLEQQIAQVRKDGTQTSAQALARSPGTVQGEVAVQGDGRGSAEVRTASPGTVQVQGVVQIESGAPGKAGRLQEEITKYQETIGQAEQIFRNLGPEAACAKLFGSPEEKGILAEGEIRQWKEQTNSLKNSGGAWMDAEAQINAAKETVFPYEKLLKSIESILKKGLPDQTV